MKKVLFFAMILFAISTATAQVEIYNRISADKEPEYDINVFGYKNIDTASQFKLFYFALVEKTWAECYSGFSYTPLPYLEVCFGLGIEQNAALYRLGGSLCLFNNNFSFLAAGEKGDGSDNYWYKLKLLYSLFDNKLQVGAMSWRYHGAGPVIQFNYKDVVIWVNPVRDLEFDIDRLVVGLDLKI